jgi:hypothetical protein
MSKSLDDLEPKARDAARRALADLDARESPYAVTSTLRTQAHQYALWLQGRESLLAVNQARVAAGLSLIPEAENRYTVTNCNGTSIALGGTGRSPHQLGRALDVVPLGPRGPEWPGPKDPRWEDIAHSFEAEGFEWGGRWADFPDRPHYQYPA